MDFALGLLATVAAVASALVLYLASPNCGWLLAARRGGLRIAAGALALLSLLAWVALSGIGAGLCAMLATWMLSALALPYLAWWSSARSPIDVRRPHAGSMPRAPLEND
ncbi:hypothetical protein [Lysobacter sp. F6437]|uniref:hypothetical protein n=1 Tax=Lysobacter sp. F6437 TaxID=3459296 RepID=UPI00403E2584